MNKEISVIITITTEYAWICLHKQSSKYEYAKTLSMAKFWIWQGSRVTHHSEYARIYLDRVLNMSQILKMPGFWIWKSSEYAWIKQGSKYATIWPNKMWIWLNMSEFMMIDRVLSMSYTIHSRRSHVNDTEPCQKIEDRALWKEHYRF